MGILRTYSFTHYRPFSDEMPRPLDLIFHDAAYRAQRLLAHHGISTLESIAACLERLLANLPGDERVHMQVLASLVEPEVVVGPDGRKYPLTLKRSAIEADEVVAAYEHATAVGRARGDEYALSEYLAVYALLCINSASDDSRYYRVPQDDPRFERRELAYFEYCGDLAGEATAAIRLAEAAHVTELEHEQVREKRRAGGKARQAPLEALKKEAFEYYLSCGHRYYSSAAQAFYDSLPEHRKALLSEHRAVETLARAIGARHRGQKS